MSIIEGTNRNDSLMAHNDADVLLGRGGDDQLRNHDEFYRYHNNVYMFGGAGNDFLYAESIPGDQFVHAANYMFGGSGNDSFIAGAYALSDGVSGIDTSVSNYILGGAGTDVVSSSANATAYMGGNSTALNIVQGDSVIDVGASASVEYGTATSFNLVIGGSSADSIRVSANALTQLGAADDHATNIVFGKGGDDNIVANINGTAGSARNLIFGGDGDDIIKSFFSLPLSNDGVNHLEGGDGNDVLTGDSQYGGGRNELFGGAGDDSLTALNGMHNIFDGGAGNDSLNGSNKIDTYEFHETNGKDAISNFTRGADIIRITGYGAALDEFADLRLSVSGGDTHIDLSASVAGAGEIILQDVSHVAADDFIFV